MQRFFVASSENYRADIDGLRAVAVLLVIFFHINKNSVPGGFVGVDIFFVISGFLITQNISSQIEQGKFSLTEFYRRRIKRIIPAMAFVVLLTTLFSQYFLLPVDALKEARSALWSMFSLGNIFFWKYLDTGYFATESMTAPLLHLWSLGVEEQFYVFWPFFLLLLSKFKLHKFWSLIVFVLAFFSFALGEWWYAEHPTFVYYMLPFRAGELMAGALAARAVMQQKKSIPTLNAPKKYFTELCAVMGVLLITWSAFCLSDADKFPGFNAVFPALGTGLMLYAGAVSNRVNSLLAFKGLVWIGLISYSAYLWHWPVLAFLRYGYGYANLAFAPGVAVFLLTLLLAYLSYRFIETPFRNSSARFKPIVTRFFILPAGVLIVLIVFIQNTDGLGVRYWTPYRLIHQDLISQTKPAVEYDYVCQKPELGKQDIESSACVLGRGAGDSQSVLLWGDSNASHYIGMLATFAEMEGFRFRNMEHGSCPPLMSDPMPYVSEQIYPGCSRSLDRVYSALTHYDVLIISASWSVYQKQNANFLQTFRKSVLSLVAQGKKIILIGKIPTFKTYDRFCKVKALVYPYLNCDIPRQKMNADIASSNQFLRELAARHDNVEYYDIQNELCNEEGCSPLDKNGEALYYDGSHLSLESSWSLGRHIVEKKGVPEAFRKIPVWLQSFKK